MAGSEGLLDAFRDYLAGFGGPVPAFLAGLDRAMPQRPLQPRSLPVTRHLARCVALSQTGRRLASALAAQADALCWGQTYTAEDFGADFLAGYGWMELFGARGHFVHDAVAGGFLLLGPHIVYPDHHHTAEEIYIPMTGGAAWRMGGGAFAGRAADTVIHHPPDVSHAMRTGAEPLLALYLWRGGPLTQKSVIGASGGRSG